MKPMKILKRPADARPGVPLTESGPSARVAASISAQLEGALARERARLEASFNARQEALIKAITSVLTDVLERVVTFAAQREADTLAATLANLTPSPPPATQEPDAVRSAFASAFENVALLEFETSVREMLTNLATVVEKQVDESVVTPAAKASNAIGKAAEEIVSAKFKLTEAVRVVELAGSEAVLASKPKEDPDEVAMKTVQTALDEGRVADALKSAIGFSALVRAKAINGALDSKTDPSDIFKDLRLSRHDVVRLIAVIASDLSDRTETRVSWLYELLGIIDDAEAGQDDDENEATKKRLEDVIGNVTQYSMKEGVLSTEAKDAKLLIRILKAQLKRM